MSKHGDAAGRQGIDLTKNAVTLRRPARAGRVRIIQRDDVIAPRGNDCVELRVVLRGTVLPRAAVNDEHDGGARPNGDRVPTFGGRR